jgi:hypothetical protein
MASCVNKLTSISEVDFSYMEWMNMEQTSLYLKVKQINEEILIALNEGDIEKTLERLRERDECMQGGLSNLESDIIQRNEVLPVLEEIIRQDSEISELLNKKIDGLKTSLTSATKTRRLRNTYSKRGKTDEPRFLDTKG